MGVTNPSPPSFHSHINRNTQYENPVTEAKRKYHASQLPNQSYPGQMSNPMSSMPPPLRAPPSFQTAAALEKQREAEAAAQWPNAGLMEYRPPGGGGGYMPQQQYLPPTPQEIEENLTGDPIKVVLTKNPTGFGFTIIGGDRPGELLQIRSIVQGGVADRDGQLKVGDVLVRVNGESVVTYNHHKVVDLFQSIPMHSPVELEVRRGYPLPDSATDELPTYSESNLSRGYHPTPSYNGGPPPGMYMYRWKNFFLFFYKNFEIFFCGENFFDDIFFTDYYLVTQGLPSLTRCWSVSLRDR